MRKNKKKRISLFDWIIGCYSIDNSVLSKQTYLLLVNAFNQKGNM